MPIYFKVRNFSWKFGTARYLILLHSRKLIPAKIFNSSVAKVFSREKKSSKTNYNKYVFISTFSVKLIFYPSTPWTDRERGKISKIESSEVRQILIQRIWQLPEHSFM